MSMGNGLPLPLPSLRLLVAPLQLASAAIWQTVQQRVVMDYGMLEEFVSMVTEIVPELLGHRQRAQLTLSLRARMILELCHSESTADLQNIQPHLDKMETLTTLWGMETDETETELELPDSNFQGLVQTLLNNPDQREHFFQDVFPVEIGPKYDTAIQTLMRTFLSSLEKFLPLPDLQQVASLLSDVPSVLEECVASVSHSQQLMTLLQYHRDLGQHHNHDTQSSPDGDCILPASSLPPVERVVIANEQIHPETSSLAKDNYKDLFSKDLELEVATVTEPKEMEMGTSVDVKGEEGEREESSIEEDCEKNNKQSSESKDEEAEDGDTVEHVAAMELMDGNTLVSDSCVFDVHTSNEEVACVGEVETEDVGKEVEPYETVMAIGEDGVVEPFDSVMSSEEDDIIEKSKSRVKIKTVFKRGIPQTLEPTVHLQKLNINNLPMPLSNRQLRQNRVLKMKTILTREHKAEVMEFSEGKTQANRTCPICGKTFNHNSDMRRHEKGHTGDRPHQCVKCRQHFRHRFTLRRHQLYVCGVDTSQPSGESNKKAKVPNKCTVCEQVVSRPTDLKRHMLTRKCQRAKNKLSNMRAQEKSRQNASPQQSEVPSEGSNSSPATGQNEPEISSSMFQQPLPGENYLETSSNVQHNTSPLESDSKEPEVENTKASSNSNLETRPVDSNSIAPPIASQPRPTPAATRYLRRRWMCRICGNYYQGDKKSHMRSHTNERPFTCPQCGLTFKYNNNLREHLRKLCKVRHRNSKDVEDICRKRFKCDECEVTFRLKSLLKAHQLTHNPLYCKVCRSILPDMGALAIHKLRHQPVQCTMCEENFNMIRHLTKHYLDVHNFSGPFVCTQCKMSYTDLAGLLRHETSHSEDYPFQCSKCPKRFKWYQLFKQHEKIHNEDKRRYLCWECGKDLSSNALLKKHMERHHHYPNPKPKDKPYFCSQCGKSFETKSSCAAHENARHSEVRYPCKDCGKQFVNSSTLTRHALIHTGERPFQCTHPACDKCFRSASELKVHMRYHTGERPFKCACGKGFTQAYYLTIHKRQHTGEKPHPCLHCDMRFDCAHSLNRHMNTHTKGGSYKCLDCGKGFGRKYLLTAHQQKNHLDH